LDRGERAKGERVEVRRLGIGVCESNRGEEIGDKGLRSRVEHLAFIIGTEVKLRDRIREACCPRYHPIPKRLSFGV
jgi:hypothetical protein